MALPTKADLLSLDFFRDGLPFVFVEAKALDTKSTDFFLDGLSFIAAGPSAGTVEPPLPVYNASQFMVMF